MEIASLSGTSTEAPLGSGLAEVDLIGAAHEAHRIKSHAHVLRLPAHDFEGCDDDCWETCNFLVCLLVPRQQVALYAF